MRVLVTGGARFIGSAICRRAILEEGRLADLCSRSKADYEGPSNGM